MKKHLISFTALIILILSTSLSMAQPNFEGKIKFKVTHDDDIMFIDYFIKDDNLRMEMGENADAVFIKNEERSFVLMPGEKMYMDLDNSIFSKIQGMAGMNEDDEEENDEEIDFDKYKTGKTKTIRGYECHQWIFKDDEDEEEVEAWVTNELGNFMLMKSPMGAGFSPGWSSSVSNNGFFPILVITKDEDGEITSRFEATEVNKQSLDSDLFSPPSNYSEMKIPGIDNLFK